MLLAIAKGDAELKAQVDEWRDHPFNPHLIARMRTVAYQKNVLIKYLQMLIAWGDQLFGQDTIETINEATQLYVLADSILGPRPAQRAAPGREPDQDLLPAGEGRHRRVRQRAERGREPRADRARRPAGSGEEAPELPRLDVLYFGIPHNDKLLSLWDTVARPPVQDPQLHEPPGRVPVSCRCSSRRSTRPRWCGRPRRASTSAACWPTSTPPMPLYRFRYMLAAGQGDCATRSRRSAARCSPRWRSATPRRSRCCGPATSAIMLDQVRLIRDQADQRGRGDQGGRWSCAQVGRRAPPRPLRSKLIDDGWNDWRAGLARPDDRGDDARDGGHRARTSLGCVDQPGARPSTPAPPASARRRRSKLKFGGKNISQLGRSRRPEVLKGVSQMLSMGAGMAADRRQLRPPGAGLGAPESQAAEGAAAEFDKQIAAADIRRLIAEQELDQPRQADRARPGAGRVPAHQVHQQGAVRLDGRRSCRRCTSRATSSPTTWRSGPSAASGTSWGSATRTTSGSATGTACRRACWPAERLALRPAAAGAGVLRAEPARVRADQARLARRSSTRWRCCKLRQQRRVLRRPAGGAVRHGLPGPLLPPDQVAWRCRCRAVAGPYTTVACTLTLTGN